MKKKGFTLVELLAVIIILGLLTGIIVTNLFNYIDQAKNNSYNLLIDNFESAAKLYFSHNKNELREEINDHGYIEITLEALINANLLDNPIKDPRNNEEILTSKKVIITQNAENIYNFCYEEKDCLSLPTVTTSESISNLTSTSVTLSGNVSDNGGSIITERGIVYGTSTNPTISDNKVMVAGTTGVFSSDLTNLSNNTNYYARAYATNIKGTSYGNNINFVTYSGGIDQYTILMMHFDGIDNGTTFNDETGKTVTRYGDTVTKTGAKKFGTASGYFDGSGDYLSLEDSDDWYFGTDDFTIDAWIYAKKESSTILSLQTGDTSYIHFYITYNLSRRLQFHYYDGTDYFSLVTDPLTFPLNQWVHVAVTRSGSDLKLYQNGIIIAENTGNNSLQNFTSPLQIGRLFSSGSEYYPFQGYIDELRISKGIARWTSNFTPPTEPYTE